VSEQFAALVERVMRSGVSDEFAVAALARAAASRGRAPAVVGAIGVAMAGGLAAAREVGTARQAEAERLAAAARAVEERRAAEAREAEARAAHEAAATAAAANEGTARPAPKRTPLREQANVVRRVEGGEGEDPARRLVFRTDEGEVVVKKEED